ncbi:probable receptor-like protein kinase At1g80640 [Tripterygium wilfordii]|uniref:probable receptor-like protein kinase At1g80640 n=1 Tax=Tripterygium wilfordii TaxID=458696 RepID=UPI0018F83C61|nr:probable receptor-like protein kinase At1g80640 [Tripterygium wilfordii]
MHFLIDPGTCSLDFNRFPYEPHSECFDNAIRPLTTQPCCRSALQSLFQAMTVRANQSRSKFLEATEAQDCSESFQALHNRTNLSICEIQGFISSSTPPNLCSKSTDSVISVLGVERFSDFKSNCKGLSTSNYSDDACFNCLVSYKQSLEAFGEGDSSKWCPEALLVSLASGDVESPNWVPATFSCLWNEINNSIATTSPKKDGYIMGSKKVLIIVILAASLLIVAPILYQLTRKQLLHDNEKEIKDLSVMVLEKTLEDESSGRFASSDLFVFSQDEMTKATKFFDNLHLIAEGTNGGTYIGILPNGMRVAIKKLDHGIKIASFLDELCRKAKIRHPNLVSVLGYCQSMDHCLVYEYCANGDLASWLIGSENKKPILTWEQRLRISMDIARGLSYMHNNPFQKTVHGDIKIMLTVLILTQLTNILLNENLEAKISLSALSIHNVKERNESETTAKDVFDFGVVLLQLLTGRRPDSLVDTAKALMVEGRSTNDIADPYLRGAHDSNQFQIMLSMAVQCGSPNERQRPNMVQVLRKLEEA